MTHLKRRSLLAAAGATGLLGLAQPLLAQQWPARDVRLINPFPVGSGPDGLSRLLADKLSKTWARPVVVENRPGGNGFIAINTWKNGAKDGTDLLVLDNVHLAAYPALFSKLPYDPEKDFKPLLPTFRTYFFFAVGKDSKYKTVADIIAAAKANPGKLNYGSWSIGNPVHLGSAMFESLTGTQIQHVVYKETSQLYAAVANGELDFALGTAGTTGPIYRSGRIRLIAITGPQRSKDFPDVPTVAESGGPADLIVTGWNTIAVPPELSPALSDKIRKDIAEALTGPDVAERFKTFGYEPFPIGQAEFTQFVKDESKRFGDVIRKANIRIE